MKLEQRTGLAVGVGLISWSLVYVASRAVPWRTNNGEEVATVAAIGAMLVVFSLFKKP